MNRLSFLKKIGLGALAVAIAPKVIAEIKPSADYAEGLISYIRRTSPPLVYKPMIPLEICIWDKAIELETGDEWIIIEINKTKRITLIPLKLRPRDSDRLYLGTPISKKVTHEYFKKKFAHVKIVGNERRS